MPTDLMYFSFRDYPLDSPGGCLASLGLGCDNYVPKKMRKEKRELSTTSVERWLGPN